MRMNPIENGVETSSEACWGCMYDENNHLCDQSIYEQILSEHEDDDHAMNHMDQAMTAHARMQKSVDVHSTRVTFDHSSLTTGEETQLSFSLEDLSSGKKITDLEIMHDKPMHVILVRDDLQHFGHIHPVLENGRWIVPYTFLAGGKYRVWVDFMSEGMMHLVDFDVDVEGDDAEEQEHLQGLQIEMKRQGTQFSFLVYDEKKNPVALTEPFLGAAAHFVTIDSTLQDFGHTHDEQVDSDHVLTFMPSFMMPGEYRGWVQFVYHNEERTAPFSFSVENTHDE